MNDNAMEAILMAGVLLAGLNFLSMALNNTHTPPLLQLMRTGTTINTPISEEDYVVRSAYLYYGVSCAYVSYTYFRNY